MRAPGWRAPTSSRFCCSRSAWISARGRRETFGINVFKVREVMRTPEITAAPEMPAVGRGHGQPARGAGAGGRPGPLRRRAAPRRRARS
ncbi:MAG: chemotaxis protein CheW [Comamonadaceae bacterium]|nr:chemotaxis protein CheW [Comamonadaceae bacterium]